MRHSPCILALMLLGCGRTMDSPERNEAVASAPAPPLATADSPPSGTSAPSEEPGGNISACLVQDGVRLPDNALHAIGTEPFWAADVQGRCVTYSTPEDQAGTRIWTRFQGMSENGQWLGALDGRPFVMTTRPAPGCSDGMSDNRYPIAVTLTVRGEQRRGCAEPTQDWNSRQRLPNRP